VVHNKWHPVDDVVQALDVTEDELLPDLAAGKVRPEGAAFFWKFSCDL
jgi:hypothetical protein